MKAIIFAAGSDGEIHPHLGIGRAWMRRGHDVLFITTSNYAMMARECGFQVLSFLDEGEKEQFLKQTSGINYYAKVRSYGGFLAKKVKEVCALAAHHLDNQSILVAPPFFYAMARLLHERYGTPYLSTVLVPAHLYSLKQPPLFQSTQWFSAMPFPLRKVVFRCAESLVLDPVCQRLLGQTCKDMKLEKPSRVLSNWWYSPQKIVALFYGWFSPACEDWPRNVVCTGFPMYDANKNQGLSDGLLRFLETGDPPVVFNPGTETQDPRAFFASALEICQALKMRAVFLTRFVEQLPPLPETVWPEAYTSLPLLLPRAKAVVHHGGIGTIALALQAGIPQLVLPTWTDQLDNGKRMERLGCGLVHRGARNTGKLIEEMRYLLHSPDIRKSCQAKKSLIRPGTEICDEVAALMEETLLSSLQEKMESVSMSKE